MISGTLSTSGLESHLNVRQKQKEDQRLVKQLLETTVGDSEGGGGGAVSANTSALTEDRSALDFMGLEDEGEGVVAGGNRSRNDDSFEAGRAAVIAPGLSDKKVAKWIDGNGSSSSDEEE